MSGHVPPPGAEDAIDKAAAEYLAAVQTAYGAPHKAAVWLVAIGGLARVASRFNFSRLDMIAGLDEARRHLARGIGR